MALSSMKKPGNPDYYGVSKPILDLKKDTVGSEYKLTAGPLDAKVRVYNDKPEEHHLISGGKTKVMSKQGIKDYISTGQYAEDSSVPELMRKQNISKEQNKK